MAHQLTPKFTESLPVGLSPGVIAPPTSRPHPAGLKLSTYRSHSPELGWTHGDHLTPSRGCSIRPLLMAAAAGQPHLHVQSCLKFHAADAEADPSIPLATPVPLELTKSTQSEPHGDGNAGPLSARCRRSEDDATRPFKQIWPLQAPRR